MTSAERSATTDPVHARWTDVDKIVQAELAPLFGGAASAREAAQKIKRQVDATLLGYTYATVGPAGRPEEGRRRQAGPTVALL